MLSVEMVAVKVAGAVLAAGIVVVVKPSII